MRRNVNFDEISDGKKYKRDDLVKVSCNGCKGCSECCKVTDDTILLDPYDICFLSDKLGKSFDEMLNQYISLRVIDGIIVPYLLKRNDTFACVFLDKEGRCSIHDSRPGFCRLFPLGRIYNDDDTFDYFIQVHECPYPSKTKIKVKNWLNIPELSKYEDFVCKWHRLTKNLSEFAAENEAAAKEINMKMLTIFYTKPYSTKSFYEDFNERLKSYLR